MHQPNFYLSEEASALRIAALVERLARNPDSPDYQRVPDRIRHLVEIVRRETKHEERKAA